MKKLLVLGFSLLYSSLVVAQIPSIGMSGAAQYQVAQIEFIEDHDYVFSCVVSSARTKKARAQTMVKAIIDLADQYHDKKIHLYLAPHAELCQEGRITGNTLYSPDGIGWKGVAKGQWTWMILTTDAKVTERQIGDTIIYEQNSSTFKKKYGVFDYHEKLDLFVKQRLGREPEYVTSGLWVDTFLVE